MASPASIYLTGMRQSLPQASQRMMLCWAVPGTSEGRALFASVNPAAGALVLGPDPGLVA
jgi:hypothetical protein